MVYTEAQVEQFCGIHAFNMLFQERKLVWIQDGPECVQQAGMAVVDSAYEEFVRARLALQTAEATTRETNIRRTQKAKNTTNSKTAKNTTNIKSIRANEKKARKAFERKMKDLIDAAEDIETEAPFTTDGVALNMNFKCQDVADAVNNNIELACTSDGLGYDGQIPYGVLDMLISELNYTTLFGMPGDWRDRFDTMIADPNFMGIIVNYRHPELHRHYAAVVKHTGAGFGYADSAAEPIMTYMSAAEIKAHLQELEAARSLNLLLFVSAKDDSAPTVALKRFRPPHGGARRRTTTKNRRRRYYS